MPSGWSSSAGSAALPGAGSRRSMADGAGAASGMAAASSMTAGGAALSAPGCVRSGAAWADPSSSGRYRLCQSPAPPVAGAPCSRKGTCVCGRGAGKAGGGARYVEAGAAPGPDRPALPVRERLPLPMAGTAPPPAAGPRPVYGRFGLSASTDPSATPCPPVCASASETAWATNRCTAPLSRKRTSCLAGCTLTSTAAGSISRNST